MIKMSSVAKMHSLKYVTYRLGYLIKRKLNTAVSIIYIYIVVLALLRTLMMSKMSFDYFSLVSKLYVD